MITSAQIASYHDKGYVIVPDLVDMNTVKRMIRHYMDLRSEGPRPGDFGGTNDHPEDSTHKFPRMINMHKWDELSAEWCSLPAILESAEQLIHDSPKLSQTMLYFKPPGGRGQGLHQDQQYITQDPLVGVWIALDPSDEAVGQMVIIPGSHKSGLLQVETADTAVSFTNAQSVLPENAQVVGADMAPGDALFFDGKTIHGSYQNTTEDRWRRSFICHYIGEHAKKFVPPQGYHVSHLKEK